MKLRNGFVSNSSSSSFIIPLDMLCSCKIDSIYNHIEEANKHNGYFDFGCIGEDDAWYISQDEYYIKGDTNMDNFDMYTFLNEFLNIPQNIIKWDHS
jgi:hypothetical protein